MSAETVLPPEGPAGPESDLQQETSRLLPSTTEAQPRPLPPLSTSSSTDSGSDAGRFQNGLPVTMGNSHSGNSSSGTSSSSGGGGTTRHPNPLPSSATVHQSQPSNCPHANPGSQSKPSHCPHANPGSQSHAPNCPHAASAAAEPRKQHPSPVSQKMQRKLRSSLSVNSDSSRKSKGSSTGSHKPGSSPEDCCVHCILACLFCEFLTLCNMVVAQASCGTCTSEACCCCCCADDLGDDCNCPCDMDCGIMDACCESSDCLEICMECCGICFPT
ncbi:myoD family inhibitor domain-containing protein isoform X2 [Engraulis encrasicolus]|uniref:myoD family inhibitor domain-containing protein isoform X2 n=1 Tax=Engraulis encrasicolus TaxID=184585 RepID=UPI002FD340A5